MALNSYVDKVCHDRQLVRYYQANLKSLLWQHQGRLPLQDLLLLSLEPRVVTMLESHWELEVTGQVSQLQANFMASEEGQRLVSSMPAERIETTLRYGDWPQIRQLVAEYGSYDPGHFLVESIRLGLNELTDQFWQMAAPSPNSFIAQYLFYQALENNNDYALAKLAPLVRPDLLSSARLQQALLRSDQPAWFEKYEVELDSLHPSMLTEAGPALFEAYLGARRAYVDARQYDHDLAVLVQAALQTGRGYQLELILKHNPMLDLGEIMHRPYSRVELESVLAFGDRQSIELVMANLEAHLA